MARISHKTLGCSVSFELHVGDRMKNGDPPCPRGRYNIQGAILPTSDLTKLSLVGLDSSSSSSPTHSWWEQSCCTQFLNLCSESSGFIHSLLEVQKNNLYRLFSPVQLPMQKAMLKPLLLRRHSISKRLCRKLFPSHTYRRFLGRLAKRCCYPSGRLVALM